MDVIRWFWRRARRVLGTVALVLLGCVPTTKEPDDMAGSGTELGNVFGVVHTADARPAAGIEVVLYPSYDDTTLIRRVRTGAEGRFAFRAEPGLYTLIALDGKGNGLEADTVRAYAGRRVDLSVRTMVPLGSLSGYVRVNGGAPTQVNLHLRRTPFYRMADPNARFDWQGLPAGDYWLHVSSGAFRPLDVPIRIEAGTATELTDTLDLRFQYSIGFTQRDTFFLDSAQLPFRIADKVMLPDSLVRTSYFTLDGVRLGYSDSRGPTAEIMRTMLSDTALRLLELRIELRDSTVSRRWWVGLQARKGNPWPHMAVRGVFLTKRSNPRVHRAARELGTFRVLAGRRLAVEELALWGWTPLPAPEPALPEELEIAIDDAYSGLGPPLLSCGGLINRRPELPPFPGDTLTFFLVPDTLEQARATRFRKDEAWEDIGKSAWYARARWPLADVDPHPVGRRIEVLLRPDGLHLHWRMYWYHDGAGTGCSPIWRQYHVDSAGGLAERLAAPPGIHPDSLLLHYRIGISEGFVADALPRQGTWVYIDSTGKGLAGQGEFAREFRVEAADLAELRGLVAGLPSPIPRTWEEDWLSREILWHGRTTRYLFSGNRGSFLHRDEERNLAVKDTVFSRVEVWLKARGWL